MHERTVPKRRTVELFLVGEWLNACCIYRFLRSLYVSVRINTVLLFIRFNNNINLIVSFLNSSCYHQSKFSHLFLQPSAPL